MSQHSRKKRRRKRNKNKQRVKSYLSSSSGEGEQDAQLPEELIESCSSPDYSPQEQLLGDSFFFDETSVPSKQTPALQGYHTDKARFEEPLARLRQTLHEKGHFGGAPTNKDLNVVHSNGDG